MGTTGERRRSRAGTQTRDRILDAALETVRAEGLVGTSARAIARTGDFNQALVFYHFGSIEELLLEALQRANGRRMDRFRPRLEEVDSLAGLVEVALDLQRDDVDGDQSALTALVAGWPSDCDVGKRIVEILRPWDDLVEAALQRSLQGSVLGQVVPTGDLAHAISCLFIGIELMGRLDPGDERTTVLFESLAGAAHLVGPLLQAMRSSAPTG
ncbi:MAG: TetR/AcrR family transcriptional regulator [Actinomycetota bacterium]